MARWLTYWPASRKVTIVLAFVVFSIGVRAEDSGTHFIDTDETQDSRPTPEATNRGNPPAFACKDLNLAVCGNAQQTAQVRDRQATQLGNRLLDNYVRSREGQLGGPAVAQRFEGIFNSALQGSLQNPLFQSVFKDFFDFTSRQMPDLKSVVDPILESMERSIDKSSFDPRDKIAMKAKIEGAHFRYEPNFNDPNDVRDYLETCGFGGLTPNARAIPDRDEVFICPGMMLGAISTSGFKDAMWGIFHVVAHETGHLIGADRDVIQAPDQFNVLRNFVQENPFSKAHTNTFACLEQRLPQLTGQERGETQGDWIADQALDERFRDSGISGTEALLRTRQALSGLCNAPSEGIHPDGATRVLIASWSVGEDLGCQNPRPQCTPGGGDSELDAGFLGVAPLSDAGAGFSGGGQSNLNNTPINPNLQQALSQAFGLGGGNSNFGGGGFGLVGAGQGGSGFGLPGAGQNPSLLGNQGTQEQQILGRLGLFGNQTSGFNGGFNPFGSFNQFGNGFNGFNQFGQFNNVLNQFNQFNSRFNQFRQFGTFGNNVFFQGGPFGGFGAGFQRGY